MNKERLLNISKSLRESPAPKKFSMQVIHRCGTPACALGHYIARKDLQDVFELRQGYGFQMIGDDKFVELDAPAICDHFGITPMQALELFDEPQDVDDDGDPTGGGCGGARTAIEAAEWIENFVATHE